MEHGDGRGTSRGLSLAAVLSIVAIVVAVATIAFLRSTGGPASASGVPVAASKVVGSLVWQTDGRYGYSMLRPNDWSAIDLGTGRGYVAPTSADGQLPMSLTAVNYLTLNAAPNDILIQRTIFEKDPSLEGWTAGMERFWPTIGVTATLARTLPEAKIYALEAPETGELDLVAFVVDGDQPISVALYAHGSDADLAYLNRTGVMSDFVTIVESVRQVTYDPGNVKPQLRANATGSPMPKPTQTS
jgi:hypothetical protein